LVTLTGVTLIAVLPAAIGRARRRIHPMTCNPEEGDVA
jgi:hypothetical protein